MISFEGVKVLLIGDFVLDSFVYTRPSRLSREAPVLVVRYEREFSSPGAAGNTSMNLLTLGVELFPITIIGNDSAGKKLLSFFRGRCETDGIILDDSIPTVTKTRILSGDYHTSKQQILRIDREGEVKPSGHSVKRAVSLIKEFAKECDVTVVSDYGYSTVRGEVFNEILKVSKEKKVIVDSRYALSYFKGVYAATPNEGEARSVVGVKDGNLDPLLLSRKVRDVLNVSILLLTRGNMGMVLTEEDASYIIPISGTDEVVDVTGAGDTVCAVFSASIGKGFSPLEAALFANYAAGVVVLKRGTATCTPLELEEQMKNFPVTPRRVPHE